MVALVLPAVIAPASFHSDDIKTTIDITMLAEEQHCSNHRNLRVYGVWDVGGSLLDCAQTVSEQQGVALAIGSTTIQRVAIAGVLPTLAPPRQWTLTGTYTCLH